MQSTCERGARAGYDGYQRKKGSKVPSAVDPLGHLRAVKVTAANAQDRAQVRSLAQDVPHGTGETVTLADVDQGDPGQEAAQAAQDDGMHLHVIRRKDATRGVVLPCRWVDARSVGWVKRLRRLARDEAR